MLDAREIAVTAWFTISRRDSSPKTTVASGRLVATTRAWGRALAARDALIESLAALPPVPSALDPLVHHFGHEAVAEVTGRTRRVVKLADANGERLAVRSRPGSSNLAETAAVNA